MDKKVNDFSISVVIPTYNAERTIKRALDSVRKQTAVELISEIIVVNDGSTDGTQKIVEDYRKNHPEISVLLINKKNGGVSSARNIGMENANGNWIALLDSDDEWRKDKIEFQYNLIKEFPEIDFLGGNHVEKEISILGRKINELYSPNVKELCIKMFPQTSTAIFKKKIFNEIGGYDEASRYCEDGQWFMKICNKYNYYYHPKQIVVFDGGKRGFGGNGLSGNLKGMQNGVRRNYAELYKNKTIGLVFYVFVSAYNELKYLRRIVISKLSYVK